MKRLVYPLICVLLAASCGSRDTYIRFSGYAQGGVYSVKYNSNGVKETPENVKSAVDSILLVIDNTLSGYNKSSVLSLYNAGENPETTPMFEDIRQKARAYKEETGGALDCGAGPLFDIWGFGFEGDSFPDEDAIAGAKAACAEEKKLNFNAIAQGYSCDLVAAYLHSIGVSDMLVDIGEIYCEGVNAAGQPWTIGVDSPEDGNNNPGRTLQGILSAPTGGCGIVTSGNYRKFYIRDGRKYAHTIDPRSGRPVEHNLLSATIIAATATDADAYATYCMVIGLEDAKEFILSRPDLEGYLIYDNGGMLEWHSPGFNVSQSGE